MRASTLVWLLSACGSVTAPHKDDAATCVPETDTAFCTRLQKTCDSFTGMDNCNQPRTASCGTCSDTMPICTANVCVAPVCGTAFVGTAGTVVAGVNITGKQSALLGASENGGTVLYLEATTTCVTSGSSVVIGDEAVAGTPPYSLQTIGALAALAGFVRSEETMTLTADGLSIIGVGTDNRSFLISTRSAVGQIDFTTAGAGPFTTLNGAVPASPATVSWPVISHDKLEFTFRVVGATDTTMNGVYDSVRATTNDPFPAATKLTGAVQTFDAITGLSSDRMSAFVTMGFGTKILTRTSLTDAFAAPAMSTPPGAAYRVVPIEGCASLIGTCEPGGCSAETICTWAKQ